MPPRDPQSRGIVRNSERIWRSAAEGLADVQDRRDGNVMGIERGRRPISFVGVAVGAEADDEFVSANSIAERQRPESAGKRFEVRDRPAVVCLQECFDFLDRDDWSPGHEPSLSAIRGSSPGEMAFAQLWGGTHRTTHASKLHSAPDSIREY